MTEQLQCKFFSVILYRRYVGSLQDLSLNCYKIPQSIFRTKSIGNCYEHFILRNNKKFPCPIEVNVSLLGDIFEARVSM